MTRGESEFGGALRDRVRLTTRLRNIETSAPDETLASRLLRLSWTVGYPSRFVCASNPLKMGSLTAVGKPAGNRADTASATRGVWVMNC
jgi:hypothetical protein